YIRSKKAGGKSSSLLDALFLLHGKSSKNLIFPTISRSKMGRTSSACRKKSEWCAITSTTAQSLFLKQPLRGKKKIISSTQDMKKETSATTDLSVFPRLSLNIFATTSFPFLLSLGSLLKTTILRMVFLPLLPNALAPKKRWKGSPLFCTLCQHFQRQ